MYILFLSKKLKLNCKFYQQSRGNCVVVYSNTEAKYPQNTARILSFFFQSSEYLFLLESDQ